MRSKNSSGSGRKRGRPAYTPTAAVRRQVSIAAGGGMRHEEIAIGLGVSVDTLRKHFEAELSVAANQRRMEALEGLYKAAKRGNSGAAKAYLAIEPQLAVPPPAPPAPAGEEKGGAKAEVLGKKEQANKDAVTAAEGTEWGDLLKRPAVDKPPVH